MTRFPALALAALLTGGVSSASPQPAFASPPTHTATQPRTSSDPPDSASPEFLPTYYCLPALGGIGMLTDGDFSQAQDPQSSQGLGVGTIFAPGWSVIQRTLDFYGPDDAWPVPHGLCSVDLDGSGSSGVGAIAHTPIETKVGEGYTVRFLFSGNRHCAAYQRGPRIKKLLVEAVGNRKTSRDFFHWDVGNNHDAEHGIFREKSWTFRAADPSVQLIFRSLDEPVTSNCGPVVAAISMHPAD
jgi:hypothetical protein